MARIAVDIDATLYDFETPAREAFLQLAEKYDDPRLLLGAYHPWTEWRSPADICGIEIWLEVIALCHDNAVILDQRPFVGAAETCQALAEEGHELLYISNRATETQRATFDWLSRYGFLNDWNDAYLVVTKDDKMPYVVDCQYLIDDRLRTCVEFVYDYAWKRKTDVAEIGGFTEPNGQRKAFVKAYEYNQAGTDIPGLYLAPTWSGLNIYLERVGVLSKRAVMPTLKA